MKLDKIHLIVFITGAILGLCTGFFSGKAIYDRPLQESVTRDTVRITDTIPHYYPQPVDGTVVRYVTKFLPMVRTDTINNDVLSFIHDTVAVQVPITSKHYHASEYDAWVSGYEPNLDSIFVYREKEIITETITKTIKDNKHFFLDVGVGCEYKFNEKSATPFAELGLKFKKGNVGIGAYGGYSHDTKENKGLPYARAKISYTILGF